MVQRRAYTYLIPIFLMTLLLFSCTKKSNTNEPLVQEVSKKFTEKFRPQYHFSPPEKWMNDPNGLVYHEGIYHLFYQHYPNDIVWGPMHWGHAVSKDLINWEHKPIALYPDRHGLIFSGSAVIDTKNTSRFGTLEYPPMVAMFTYHLMEGEKAGRTDFQTQGIAFSLDNGASWEKYKENPVIGNDGIKDFRDPKVFWHEDTGQWVMVLVAGDHAKFYRSKDLKEWSHMSDFGKDKGAHGGVWECPDLFKLKVDGTNEEKWVLLISINPGAPNGGSGTQYFIGDFDGESFTTEQDDIRWLDYGTDNYAGVTYNNEPNGDRIFIGWMSNWNYARNTPTKVWRSAMTLPRKLTLTQEGSEFFIKSIPINAVENLMDASAEIEDLNLTLGQPVRIENDHLNESKISFTLGTPQYAKLEFSNDENDRLILELDPEKQKVMLDRTKSGLVDFEPSFGAMPHEMPIAQLKDNAQVDIFLDRSSIELFIDGGRYVMTDQIFPKEALTQLVITGTDGQSIKNLKVQPIRSIWHE